GRMVYLSLAGALPRPPPEGLPVVLGRFAIGGAFDPPDFPAGAEPLLPPLDFDMTISLAMQDCVSN
ncbi:MAG: hypothetical protein ABIO21_26270, partial [Pseudomonas sp.]